MNEVERYYDRDPQREWDRLTDHRTEFALTMKAIGEYAPGAPAQVVDIGGGPGRYSIALAQAGYDVTLVDLSSKHLEFAKARADEAGVVISDFVHSCGADLSALADESCDVALLMGPLYHLTTHEERLRSIAETRRVLKPGGVVFAAVIGRYGFVRQAAKDRPEWLASAAEICDVMLTTGIFKAEDSVSTEFTSAYFAHPTEVKPLLESGGFETLDLIATEGVISMIEEKVNELEGELWERWVELNYRLGKDPSVHGCAEHLLYVGKKVQQMGMRGS